jgi:hypothetical protein
MFFKKEKFNSLDIAKQVIKNTGLDENLGILKQKNHVHRTEPFQYLKLIMALSTTNLVQTLKTDFIVKEIPQATLEEVVRHYVEESLKQQALLKLKKPEMEDMLRGVMAVVADLDRFWTDREDIGGPGPRYFCVKEVLKRMGGAENFPLHDALFELMYLQYRHYLKYFQQLLSQPEEGTA